MRPCLNSITKRLDKLADYQINPNIALVSYFMCAKKDEEARKRAEGLTFFLSFLGNSADRGRPPPGTVNLWDEFVKWKGANPDLVEKALRGGLVGLPDTIRKKLRRFKESHADQAILLNQAGKNSHEHTCESLEIFAEEVMPEFHADEGAHQNWKQQVMSGEIELEELVMDIHKDRNGKTLASRR